MYLPVPAVPAHGTSPELNRGQSQNDTAQQNENRKAIVTKPETCLCWKNRKEIQGGRCLLFCGSGRQHMARVPEEQHAEEASQIVTVPNCSGPGRARLLRKHLAEAAISKDGIFSALDCCMLISNPPSPLARPTRSLPGGACGGTSREGGT